MKMTDIRRALRIGLSACGAVVMITGVIKFGGVYGWLDFLSPYLPAGRLNLAHDWSGFLLVIFVATLSVYGRFTRRPAPAVTAPIAPPQHSTAPPLSDSTTPPRRHRHFGAPLALLVLLVAAVAWFYWQNSRSISADVRQLAAVEVREYQGERLSSVADLPDNSIKGPQRVDVATYQLAITGLVDAPQSLDYQEAIDRQRYTKVVDLHCVEGWSAKLLWEGVLLRDLLAVAQPRPEATTVIFHAYDGYTSSLSLDYLLQNDILLGFKMNGEPLLPERGFPFQLVAEDKWGYKWVKWVTRIELSDDPNYRGTWESRGYNNDGAADGPRFEP